MTIKLLDDFPDGGIQQIYHHGRYHPLWDLSKLNKGGVGKLLGVAFNKFSPPSTPSPSIHIQFASPLAVGI